MSIYVRDLDCCSQKEQGTIPFATDKEAEASRSSWEISHNSE